MPVIHRASSKRPPTLYYESEPSEKTLKLREEFKIDESGYPEHYRWRGLAKLGPVYSHKDPFLKFHRPKKEDLLDSRIYAWLCPLPIAIFAHHRACLVNMTSHWNRLWRPFLQAGVTGFLLDKFYMWYMLKDSKRDEIFMDYVDAFPERFEPIKRYKWRDALMLWTPAR